MKHLTKAISDAKYSIIMALAEEVIGYETELPDENGDLQPNPQSKELWLESIYNGMCQKGFHHMKLLKRNKELGEVTEDEL